MKEKPEMAMSHFLYTDPKLCRQRVNWTESETTKFNDAVREVGNKPYQISSIVGSKTSLQVSGHIDTLRNSFKRDPAMPNADVAKILIE